MHNTSLLAAVHMAAVMLALVERIHFNCSWQGSVVVFGWLQSVFSFQLLVIAVSAVAGCRSSSCTL
jgi:hypothetical protein